MTRLTAMQHSLLIDLLDLAANLLDAAISYGERRRILRDITRRAPDLTDASIPQILSAYYLYLGSRTLRAHLPQQ